MLFKKIIERRICILSLFLSLYLFIFIQKIFAYGLIHENITSKSVDISNLTLYLKNELDFNGGIDEKLKGPGGIPLSGGVITLEFPQTKSVKEWIKFGSIWEDLPIGLKAITHFYNPINGFGLTDLPDYIAQDQTALERALTGNDSTYLMEYSWTHAKNYYFLALTEPVKENRNENFAKIFRALGHTIHLLEDMAVPAHVRNDNHFPVYYGKDLFEEYWKPERVFPTYYPAVRGSSLNNQGGSSYSIENFWDTNLSSNAFGKGLAEFTNYNFFSRDTIQPEVLQRSQLEQELHLYPSPIDAGNWHTVSEQITYQDVFQQRTETVNVDYLQWDTIDNYSGSLILNPNLSARSYFDFETKKEDPSYKVYSLNNTCFQKYGEFLIPRAVSYCAGLINYFFRGSFGVSLTIEKTNYPGEFNLSLKITNNTGQDTEDISDNETMVAGSLMFGYMKPDGTLEQIFTKSVGDGREIPKLESGNSFFIDLFYVPMAIAENTPVGSVKFVLVYRGKLGTEEDTVVGKIFKPTNYPLIENVDRPQWFPDSNKVLFQRRFEGLYSINVDETNLTQLLPVSYYGTGNIIDTRISPLGTKIAFRDRNGIALLNLDSGLTSRLTAFFDNPFNLRYSSSDPTYSIYTSYGTISSSFTWLPSGDIVSCNASSWVYYTDWYEGKERDFREHGYGIILIDVQNKIKSKLFYSRRKSVFISDETGKTPGNWLDLTSDSFIPSEVALWSPDGALIALRRSELGLWNTWLINNDLSNLTQILGSTSDLVHWSPDSKKILIAYKPTYTNTYQYHVFDTLTKQTTVLPLSYHYLWDSNVWSPDSRRLIGLKGYWSSVGSIYLVNGDGTDEQVLLSGDHSFPSLSKDGKILLYRDSTGRNVYILKLEKGL